MKKLILSFIAILSFAIIGNTTDCPSAEIIPSSPSLPYTQSLVCGTLDDITAANSAAGTGANYLGGLESVYTWTPTSSYSGVTIDYTGQTWTGIFLYEGCPTSGGTLVGLITGSANSKTLTVAGNINSGTTYYIVFDTWPAPPSPCTGSFTLNGTELALCSGMPSPGSTISTVASACPAVAFSLSLQNPPTFSGYSFQWQISSDGLSYTSIAGATGATYSATQTTSNFYQCIVTCISDGTPVISTPLQVGSNPFYNCYCTVSNSTGTSACIQNVIFNTISNNTGGCSGAATSNYSSGNGTTSLIPGQAYDIDITCSSNAIVSVWIDFDQSGTYDPTEWFQPYITGTTGILSITVPASSNLGTTGMRIRSRSSGSANGDVNPCTNFFSGETEDYTVTIGNPCNPISIVNPGSQSVCSAYTLPPIAEVTPSGNLDLTMNYYSGPGGTGSVVVGPITSTQTIYAYGSASSGACSDDQVFTINVGSANTGVDSQTACGPFTWINGVTYTSNNNTATHILTNVSGCDSIVTLNLTIGATNTGIDTQYACGTYTWINGVTYSTNNNSATFTLTNVSGCDSIVTLNLTIAAASINANGNTTLCQNQSVVLQSSATSGNIWSNGSNSPSIVVSTPGVYSVTVTDAFGCVTTSNTINVVVNSLPTVYAGTDQTFCSGTSITLSATGAQNYTWNNGIVDGQPFTPNASLYCIVSGIDVNGCSDTDTLFINVKQPSFYTIIGSSITSYTLNGQTYTQSGVYTQTYLNAVGCDSIITLDLSMDYLGLSENGQASFSVFPNPATDVLNIQFLDDLTNSSFEIIDLQGRKVLEGNLNSTNSKVDLTEIQAGNYFLKLGVSSRKIQFLKL